MDTNTRYGARNVPSVPPLPSRVLRPPFHRDGWLKPLTRGTPRLDNPVMELTQPGALFSGLIIGVIGMALFIYGKKQQHVPSLVAGVGMCVFPYFVTSLVVMWLLAVLCIGGLWASNKLA
ncbi:MAG: hypothetical protein SFY96_14550 [Planctomycetota bacterium]|nr:hypothetical protein [Planctomycetota bacterium]